METKIESSMMTLNRIFNNKLYYEYEEKSAAFFQISLSKGDSNSFHVGLESQSNTDVITTLVDPAKVKRMRARRKKLIRQLTSNEPARSLDDVYKIKPLKSYSPEPPKRKVLQKKMKKIVEPPPPLPDVTRTKSSKKGKKSTKNVKPGQLGPKEVKTPRETSAKQITQPDKVPKSSQVNDSSTNDKPKIKETINASEQSNNTIKNINSRKVNDSKTKEEINTESKITEVKDIHATRNIGKVDVPKEKSEKQNLLVIKAKTEEGKVDAPKEKSEKQNLLVTKAKTEEGKVDVPKEKSEKQNLLVTKAKTEEGKVDVPKEKSEKQNLLVTKAKTEEGKVEMSTETATRDKVNANDALNTAVDMTHDGSTKRVREKKIKETKNETEVTERKLKSADKSTTKTNKVNVKPAKPEDTKMIRTKPIVTKPKIKELKRTKVADLKPPDLKRKIIKKEIKLKDNHKNKSTSRVGKQLHKASKSGRVPAMDDKNALPFFARPCAQLKEIKKTVNRCRGERPQYHGIHMHTRCFEPRGYAAADENCEKTAVFERYLTDVARLNGGPLEEHVYRRGRLYDGMCQELVSLERVQEQRPREFAPRAEQCGECRRHENEAETLFLYKSSHQDQERNVVRQAGYPII